MDEAQRNKAPSSQMVTAMPRSERGPMNEVPLCLIRDILSRLPIKSILNSRCVCKDWLHCISDSLFANLHLERSPPTYLLIKSSSVYPESWNLQLAQITGKPSGLRYRVADRMTFFPKINLPNYDLLVENSCNGLLCLTFGRSDIVGDDIYLCNPILGEYISIPVTASDQGKRDDSYFSLGFSPISKEYKVLHTFYLKRKPAILHPDQAEIYTVGTGKWRIIHKPLRGPPNSMFDSFVCGSFHWVIDKYETLEPIGIGSFNFESEQFRQLSLPPRNDRFSTVAVTVCEGSLGVSFFERGQFEVWVMKKYGSNESWTRQLSVRNRVFYQKFHEPLIFLNNGLILMLQDDDCVIFYDTRRKFMNVIRICQNPGVQHATAYKPSFVSLKDIAKVEEVKMTRIQASGEDQKSSSNGTSNCRTSQEDQLSKSTSPDREKLTKMD